MNNMTIDVLEPVFDPAQNRYKLVAKATILAVEFIDRAELVNAAKFKKDALLGAAKEKVIAKVLITVVEAAEKIRANMPQQNKGDPNDGAIPDGNNA